MSYSGDQDCFPHIECMDEGKAFRLYAGVPAKEINTVFMFAGACVRGFRGGLPLYSLSNPSTMIAPIEAGITMTINLLSASSGSESSGNLLRLINTQATTIAATI